MAITEDVVVQGKGGSSVTVSLTVGNNSNRYLLVGVAVHQGTVSNVTFNGTALTRLVTVATSFNETAELWGMNAPAVTTANVVATQSGGSQIMIGAISLYNVYQFVQPAATASAIGNSSQAAVSITTKT